MILSPMQGEQRDAFRARLGVHWHAIWPWKVSSRLLSRGSSPAGRFPALATVLAWAVGSGTWCCAVTGLQALDQVGDLPDLPNAAARRGDFAFVQPGSDLS